MDVASFELQSPQEFLLWPQFLTLQAESKSCLLSEGAFFPLSCLPGQMGNVCDKKRVLKTCFLCLDRGGGVGSLKPTGGWAGPFWQDRGGLRARPGP